MGASDDGRAGIKAGDARCLFFSGGGALGGVGCGDRAGLRSWLLYGVTSLYRSQRTRCLPLFFG